MPHRKENHSDSSDDGAVSAKNIITRTPRSAKKVAQKALKSSSTETAPETGYEVSSGSEYEVEEDEITFSASALCESDGIGGEEMFKFKPERTPQGKMKTKIKELVKDVAPTKTPRRARKSIHRKLSKIVLSDSDSSSDSNCSDDDKMDDHEDYNGEITLRTTSRTPSSSVTISESADEYFDSRKRGHTSDHTLSRLETPKMPQRQIQLLCKTATKHQRERQELIIETEECFAHWKLLLRENFNLLLYGVGSKFNIIQRFRELQMRNSYCVVVNGFFPGISIRQILGSLCEALDDCKGFSSSGDDLERLVEYLSSENAEELYVLIHNIDGLMLRVCQPTLSRLASLPRLHMLASIDHINAPLMWDSECSSAYRWVWWEVSTFNRYLEETSWEGSLLVQQQTGLALASLHHVFISLNPNAQGIFMIIVDKQLENQEDPAYIGMSFGELYSRCREAFLVNSDLTLRAQLTEFRDHRLIKSKRAADGAEHLYCPVEIATIKEFIATKDSL